MFRGRHRPKGLEMSACRQCNSESSRFELVASALGRTSLGSTNEIDQREFARLLRDADANNPGLRKELKPSQQQLDEVEKIGLAPGSGALNTGGQIVQKAFTPSAPNWGLRFILSASDVLSVRTAPCTCAGLRITTR